MAFSTDNYFSNSIIGQPQVGADIDIFDSSSTPKYAIGFGFTRADGSKYRYCHFGGLSNRGLVVAREMTESAHTRTVLSAALVSPTLVKIAGETLDPNQAGSRYMQVCVTAAAHQFAGGYVTVCNAGSGTGFTYRIKDNSAVGDPSTGYCYLELYEKLQAPVDTTSALCVDGSPYANLKLAASYASGTGMNAAPVGVTVQNMSASTYGWVQTRGICGTIMGFTGSPGGLVTMSATTSGYAVAALAQVSATHYAVSPIIGWLYHPETASSYSQVFLTLE